MSKLSSVVFVVVKSEWEDRINLGVFKDRTTAETFVHKITKGKSDPNYEIQKWGVE